MANGNTGVFLPTTEILDVGRITDDPNIDDKLKEVVIRIAQAFNDTNNSVNLKTTGFFLLEEFVDSNKFFPDPTLSSLTSTAPEFRQEFRKVIDFGSLPNAGTKSVAHGITITNLTTFTKIYGTASDIGASKEYIPLPFVDVSGTVAAGNIEIHIDGTNINITTTGNGTNFTVCYVILEYLQS